MTVATMYGPRGIPPAGGRGRTDGSEVTPWPGVHLASQPSRRRTGRSLKILVRHVQLSRATVPRLRQPGRRCAYQLAGPEVTNTPADGREELAVAGGRSAPRYPRRRAIGSAAWASTPSPASTCRQASATTPRSRRRSGRRSGSTPRRPASENLRRARPRRPALRRRRRRDRGCASRTTSSSTVGPPDPSTTASAEASVPGANPRRAELETPRPPCVASGADPLGGRSPRWAGQNRPLYGHPKTGHRGAPLTTPTISASATVYASASC